MPIVRNPGPYLTASLMIAVAACSGKGGPRDMQTLTDQGGADLSVPLGDMTAAADLSASVDLRVPPDLTVPPDMRPPADLTADLTPVIDMRPAGTVVVGPGGAVSFDPPMLTILVGQTVTWTWDSSGHNVVSGAGGVPDNLFCSPKDTTPCNMTNSPVSPAGTVYTHKFDKAGTYPYFCRPHAGAGMTGTIVVM